MSLYQDSNIKEPWRPGRLFLKTKIEVKKFANDADFKADKPFEVKESEGNVGLNEGIQNALDLLIGVAGAVTYTCTGLTKIGVGTATDAESATQAGLKAAATGATSMAHATMDATTYPSRSSQTISFRSTFGATVANFAWNEFTITDCSAQVGINLIRKLSQQGTKVSGQTWQVTVSVAMS